MVFPVRLSPVGIGLKGLDGFLGSVVPPKVDANAFSNGEGQILGAAIPTAPSHSCA